MLDTERTEISGNLRVVIAVNGVSGFANHVTQLEGAVFHVFPLSSAFGFFG